MNSKEYLSKRDKPSQVEQFRKKLTVGKYQPSTIANYLKAFLFFSGYVEPLDLSRLSKNMIELQLADLIEQEKPSPSYINHIISSLKAYYSMVEGWSPSQYDFTRPTIERPLPKILKKEDIKRMIQNTSNIKNRVIVMLLYGTGIRPGEVVKIKRTNIDIRNGKMRIAGSGKKGSEARLIDLPESLLRLIKVYLREVNPYLYLIEGQKEGSPLSQRSLEMRIKEVGKAAGIPYPVTCMTFRHTFAVHMIETGVNIHYLKEILGLQSTHRLSLYMNVAKFRKPNSPLDEIDLKAS